MTFPGVGRLWGEIGPSSVVVKGHKNPITARDNHPSASKYTYRNREIPGLETKKAHRNTKPLRPPKTVVIKET